MSLNSVNTNIGAMVALQSLNRTNEEMAATQKRISTGFRVADARDDGAAFAVAERIRGDLAATASANQQLGGVKGLLDTTRTGLENISKALQSVKATVVKLADSNITPGQRQQYMAALKEQFAQIANFISDTTYNGQSMLNTTATAGDTGTTLGQIRTVRNGEGATYAFAKIATAGINGQAGFTGLTNLGMTTSGVASGTTLLAAISSFAAALTTGGAVNQAINTTLTALNNLGSYSRYVDSQINFNKAKMDAQEAGMGALIDADLAKESARLQSLQIRQQLGTQALSIANQAPQALLSLFR
ncbi:flagellin N-terminal helical domain-containing protein [Rubritepida flocculans]|uniref:flagellin N-terminal helical domain-containing protein n=1 Tax=Rubritepida flocculans TaxID=182403 RepID=UPI0003FFBDCF|nr:flagellin [Rubritepida flocculans]